MEYLIVALLALAGAVFGGVVGSWIAKKLDEQS